MDTATATREDLTLVDMFREEPVETAMVTVLPVFLAFAQLANSVVNGLSFAVSVPFAVVVVGFTVLVTQYGFVRFRRRTLEQRIEGPQTHVGQGSNESLL